MKKKGLLIVVSGPAGSGKGTILGNLFKRGLNFAYSVSATTRKPRPGEENGVNYYYITREAFEEKIKEDGFIEYAEYVGNYYGTLKSEVEERLNAGVNVILEIEVQGALQIKKKFPQAVFILLLPPDYSTLAQRLRGRGTEPEDVILMRLEQAKSELRYFDTYDYVITNENGVIEPAVDTIISIVNAEQHKTARTDRFVETFLAN